MGANIRTEAQWRKREGGCTGIDCVFVSSTAFPLLAGRICFSMLAGACQSGTALSDLQPIHHHQDFVFVFLRHALNPKTSSRARSVRNRNTQSELPYTVEHKNIIRCELCYSQPRFRRFVNRQASTFITRPWCTRREPIRRHACGGDDRNRDSATATATHDRDRETATTAALGVLRHTITPNPKVRKSGAVAKAIRDSMVLEGWIRAA